MAKPSPSTPAPSRGRPKLSTISNIGRNTLVRGTHGLSQSQYDKLLKHPETRRIFQHYGVADPRSVLYAMRKNLKQSVSSLEQGRRIFKALQHVAGSPHAEEIKRSATLGHKTPGQLIKEAERREGPTKEQLEKEKELKIRRVKGDRAEQILYAQSRARARSSIMEGTQVAEHGEGAKTSVLDQEHRSTIFNKPDDPKSGTPSPKTDPGRPVELTGGAGNMTLPSSENQPPASEPPAQTEPQKKSEATDESGDGNDQDVKLPPPAKEEGLPL